MNNAPIWIEVVENGISVALIAGSEDHDIEVFAQFFDDFFGVGPDIDVAIDNSALNGLERHFDFIPLHHDLTRMDQGFVHIENNSFSTYITTILYPNAEEAHRGPQICSSIAAPLLGTV